MFLLHVSPTERRECPKAENNLRLSRIACMLYGDSLANHAETARERGATEIIFYVLYLPCVDCVLIL